MPMTVDQLFSKLARGQLKNVAATDDAAAGLILPEKENQILELANQGLTDIFTRKKLREGRGILTLAQGVNEYVLTDVNYPRFVKVLEFVTGDERSHTPRTNKHIFQTDEQTFQFSDKFIEHYLELGYPSVEVRYQRLHDVVARDDTIMMPSHLEEALVLYIAGLYLSHMGGENHSKKGDSYYGLYLQMLTDDKLENRSGESEILDDDTRFYDRGFV